MTQEQDIKPYTYFLFQTRSVCVCVFAEISIVSFPGFSFVEWQRVLVILVENGLWRQGGLGESYLHTAWLALWLPISS